MGCELNKKHNRQPSKNIEKPNNDYITSETNYSLFNNYNNGNKNNNLKLKLKDRENEITKLNADFQSLKKENKNLISQRDKLISKNNDLKQEIERLQNKLIEKKELINKNNKEIEKLKEVVSDLEKEAKKLKKNEKENKSFFENIISKNKVHYEKIIKKQDKDIEKYKEENMNFLKKNDDISKLKKELEQLKKENSLLKLNKEPILVGLNNIGATCYMNATLQCLSNTTNLTEYFLKIFKYEQNNKSRIISNQYYNVVKNLWDRNNNNKSFSPESFKEKLSQENPLFKGIQANDSKDLINFLLERFHLELNEPKNVQNNNMMNNYVIAQNDQLNEDKMLKIFINEFEIKYNSIISNLFYGMFETKSQCQKCKNIKYNFQVYSFLEFPLEQVNKFCFNQGKRQNYNSNKNPDVDLYECFEYNSNLELMSGDNQMYCNICNSTQNALYGTQIYSAPNYLIINLNRGRGAVYECKVNFPEKINLLNFITFKNENTFFELYAVISHLGPSSMSGHFVAYCKRRKDENFKWYLFNDAIVSECKNKEEYRNGMPYILFYKAV